MNECYGRSLTKGAKEGRSNQFLGSPSRSFTSLPFAFTWFALGLGGLDLEGQKDRQKCQHQQESVFNKCVGGL